MNGWGGDPPGDFFKGKSRAVAHFGRMLALDVGDRTIGVAASDELGITANPVETIRRKGRKADVARIRELVVQRHAVRVLVGLPVMLDGSHGVQAEKVLEFVEKLRPELPVPVVLWDERLSTVAAERALIQSGLTRKRRRKVIDQVAAVYFLQGFLDYLQRHPEVDPDRFEPPFEASPAKGDR